VGGSPAWLDPVDLPTERQLQCQVTGKPLDFLLQIYAPDEDAGDAAFHRSIFLFTPPGAEHVHCRGAVRAFRCQLPLANPFYPPGEPPAPPPPARRPPGATPPPAGGPRRPSRPLPPNARPADPPGDAPAPPPPLSDADAAASTARDRWGVVARERGVGPSHPGAQATLLRAFPEQELAVEPESDAAGKSAADPEVQRVLADYERRQAAAGEGGDGVDEEELGVIAGAMGAAGAGDGADPDRVAMAAFQARVDGAPGQVLRYCFQEGARPTWPAAAGLPGDGDVPACGRCGGPRRFEMMVLPHLVASLGQDDEAPGGIDFGALAVYSCARSCDPAAGASAPGESRAYAEEFVWALPPL